MYRLGQEGVKGRVRLEHLVLSHADHEHERGPESQVVGDVPAELESTHSLHGFVDESDRERRAERGSLLQDEEGRRPRALTGDLHAPVRELVGQRGTLGGIVFHDERLQPGERRDLGRLPRLRATARRRHEP